MKTFPQIEDTKNFKNNTNESCRQQVTFQTLALPDASCGRQCSLVPIEAHGVQITCPHEKSLSVFTPKVIYILKLIILWHYASKFWYLIF